MKITIYYILILLCLISCASQGRIGGGPKDETPPKVVESKSTPNFQTQFELQDIKLEFDEFVNVKNALKEMVISPPLTYLPKVEGRGKKVTFKFNEQEVLKEDATYSINFGKSIQDIRENNPIENYSFVFSTGDYIDSLSVSGLVVDAINQKAVSDMLVMLYTSLEDSIPYLERPFYSTRTDKEGKFLINNIKADTFKIFALKDENVNYLYDLETEKIAYQDSLLYMTDSANYNQIKLLAFQEDPTLRVIESIDKEGGIIKVVFNQEIEEVDYRWTGNATLFEDYSKDSLLLFYDTAQVVGGDTLFIFEDTLLVKNARAKSKPRSFNLTSIVPNLSRPISPKDSLTLQFSTPILTIIEDSILVQDSSNLDQTFAIRMDTEDSRKGRLRLEGADFSKNYSLTFLPGSIVDVYKQSNRDTLSFYISYLLKEETGIIELNFIELIQDSNNYIIEIQENKRLLEKLESDDLADSLYTIEYLSPGTYNLKLIKDENHNGRQDAGNYLRKEAQEEEKILNLPPLKADWKIEENVSWSKIPELTNNKETNKIPETRPDPPGRRSPTGK